MRKILPWIALVLLASTAHGASPYPPKKPPTDLVIVACRVVDWTGLRPLPYNVHSTARGYRDLEWFTNDKQEYECRREILRLEDSTPYDATTNGKELPLDADFSKREQCAARAVEIGPRWNDMNKGWAVMAIGCPVPYYSDNGTPNDSSDDFPTGSYKMPECPSHQPGSSTPENPEGNRMRCSFDESVV